MKNKIWILIVCLLIILIGIFTYFLINPSQGDKNSYQAQKTSSEDNYSENQSVTENVDSKNTTPNVSETTQESLHYEEEQLATFSTKIYSKDSERQNNIEITCNTLNDTVVKNGETFSFCSTVGKATSSKGYEKADVFDHNGNKTKGLRWW